MASAPTSVCAVHTYAALTPKLRAQFLELSLQGALRLGERTHFALRVTKLLREVIVFCLHLCLHGLQPSNDGLVLCHLVRGRGTCDSNTDGRVIPIVR